MKAKKTVGPSIAFLKANHDIVLSIATDTPELLTKHNPNPSYFLVQDYDARAEKVYLNSREIVYSFSHSDTLVLYNLFTGAAKKTKLLTNNFLPNTPFDYSNASSMEYGTSYAMSNTRMGAGSLYFDSSQHRIYQLMQHRGQYIDDNGAKHDYNEIPKSLFVLDDRLNQLMEIYIPPNTFASKFYSFITHKGLYFAAHPSKQKYRDKMLFYRIVVP